MSLGHLLPVKDGSTYLKWPLSYAPYLSGWGEGKTESWEKCLFTLSFFNKKTLLWKSDQKCLLFSNNFSQLKDTFCPLTSTIFYDFIYGCILTLIYGYRFLDLCQGFRTKFLGQYGKKLVMLIQLIFKWIQKILGSMS